MREQLKDIKTKLREISNIIDDNIINTTNELAREYENINSLKNLDRDIEYWIENIVLILEKI